MNLTNKHNLPPVIYNRIQEDINSDPYGTKDHDGPCFRTTELIGPPLPGTLFKRYKNDDKLEIDASFYLAMLFGTAFHKLCEGESDTLIHYEQKFNRKFIVDELGECTLFGTVDELEIIDKDSVFITDNKTGMTSHMAFPVKQDYQWQLNIYNLLADIKDRTIRLFVRMFLKDFTVIGAARDSSKPQCQMAVREIEVMPRNKVITFIEGRIKDHIETPDRPCTQEERNFGSVKYAIERSDRKRALRVLDTYEEAVAYHQALDPKVQAKAVINRRADDIKCRYYCQARSVCDHAISKGY